MSWHKLLQCCVELKYPCMHISSRCCKRVCMCVICTSLFLSARCLLFFRLVLVMLLFSLSLSLPSPPACVSYGCHLPEGACSLRFSERDQVSKKFKECKLPTAHFLRACLCKNVIFYKFLPLPPNPPQACTTFLFFSLHYLKHPLKIHMENE